MRKLDNSLVLANIFLSVLSFLFLLLLRWNSFAMPYERDEGEYAYSAWILRQGIFPYENSFLQKPPMIIYTYYIGQIISDTALWPPRFLAFISVFLTALILGIVAGKIYSFQIGWGVVFLTELVLSFPYFTALASNTEIFMILFFIVVFSLYFYYQEKASYLVWFLSGIFSSFSLFYKPIVVLPILFLCLVWVYKTYVSQKSLQSVFIRVLFAFTGFFIVSGFMLLPFLLFGKLIFLKEAVVDFNLFYAKVWDKYGLSGFTLQIGKLVRVWYLLFLPFIFFIFSSFSGKKVILGLMLFSLLASFRTTIGHYYLTFMPFLALGVVLGIWNIYVLLSQKFKISFSSLFFIFLILLIYPLRMQFSLTSQQLSLWIYGIENPFVESALVSQKIVENSKPSDYIFVAGSEPQIYFYSKRMSPTRFIITYPLNIYSPKRENYQREVVEKIRWKRPRIIVYSNKLSSGFWEDDSPRILFDYVKQEISNNYFLIGGCYIDSGIPVWKNSGNDENLDNASFVLYKLKDGQI